MKNILDEDSNCWRISHAQRASFLIDGEDYFRTVREAMKQAQHSIFIIGWDIHSELQLIRDDTDDGYSHQLGPLLNQLAAEKNQLNIYILNWDFAMIYVIEREFFPHYKLRWKSHKRIHFCLDGNHPVGASQHQKLVVVDDQLAFVGGMDLSQWRWDTSQHKIDDPRRRDPNGKPYPPFHDVMMLVDGDAARSIGELARERWRIAANEDAVAANSDSRSTGTHITKPVTEWPQQGEPDLQDIAIGIARTLPAYRERTAVREVEQLYLQSIAAAEQFIYIENQYFSSQRIGEALQQRLQEDDGPEVIVVMPEKTGGWLEQHTMDVLRARLLSKLKQADKHDRLRIYYVQLSASPAVSLMIHAKVMVIDDCFARVASSNLSNRSMGLDSECDLALQSSDTQDCDAAISGFRRRLLAEHLDVSEAELAEAEQQQPSLIQAIESLRGGQRSLQPLSTELPAEVDSWVPESELLDPEKPVEPDEFFNHIIQPQQQKPAYRYMLRLALLLLGVVALAAAWRWGSLGDWLTMQQAEQTASWIEQSSFSPLLVILAYVIGGLLMVPITLMIIATVSVFGPWYGAGYALLGAELSAIVSFMLGHLLGNNALRRIAGSRVNRISKAIARRGVLTIITLRIVPVAPFSVINIIAGATAIRLRDFALGSFLGMIPGVVSIAILADRLLASLRDPSPQSILILAAAIVLVILSLLGLRQWSRRKRQAS
ncbi:MAG TPA: VTT domain-containing protein [Gammaproteobacteria bacterium]